jgi:flagellar basal-body rod protein FlgG
MQALNTAATGMAAQELSVQVIANNIANLQTTGYKKQTVAFQDLIYQHIRRVGAQSSDQGTILPVGIDLGGGVKTVGTPRMMTQGTLSQTGNDLDLAITGEGFFKVLQPDGTFQYTRDGTFQMDNQGRIVTAQGNPVQPTITVPNNSSGLTVNAQGQVSVTLPGSTTSSIGNNQFTDTPSSGPPQDGLANAEGYGSLTQGSLEQANVDVVSEMSNMIAAQRAYEMNSKVISAADQMMQATSALFR